MISRIIKPQIIKRLCHYSRETNYSRMLDKLNIVEINSNLTAEKIAKLEKTTSEILLISTYNYVFTFMIIPVTILFTI
jgi:hypothetical protein